MVVQSQNVLTALRQICVRYTNIKIENSKIKLLGYFVGQVMKRTKGKANPKLLNDLLIKMIS